MKAKSRTLLIITCILGLLIVSGCSGGFLRGRSDGIESYDFQKGTEGLKMEFLDGMPPDKIYIGMDFSTGIKIKNMGAYDMFSNSNLKITVPDQSAFDFGEGASHSIDLRGKSLYVAEGEEDVLIFPMKALCFPGYSKKIVTNYSRKMRASACYYYETTANADICVDTRKFLRQPHEKPECKMDSKSLSGGQGGPVGVVSISPSIIPISQEEVTLQLSVSFKNLQSSDHSIFGPDSNCNPREQNKVRISVEMGGEQMDCTPSEINLKSRDAVGTICKRQVKSDLGAYLTPVTVNMQYYVEQNIVHDINVEAPPGPDINCGAIGGDASGSGGGDDRCGTAHPGFACRTVSCQGSENIETCSQRLGCFRGLCSGGTTNICCPP